MYFSMWQLGITLLFLFELFINIFTAFRFSILLAVIYFFLQQLCKEALKQISHGIMISGIILLNVLFHCILALRNPSKSMIFFQYRSLCSFLNKYIYFTSIFILLCMSVFIYMCVNTWSCVNGALYLRENNIS